MSKKVAVVLSGCGVFDGAEIYESVLTLLRLAESGAEVSVFAPNIPQMHVVNHLTGEVIEGETRNVLTEAARVVRGEISDVASAKADEFDALVVPGGFGAAKNLSDFAVKGGDLTVNEDFLAFAKAFHSAQKPIGLICIAPAMAAKICGEGAQCTIGNDADTAAAINATGAQHCDCLVTEFHFDETNKLVTTPAYMLAGSITEAATGINKLVDKVLSLV
ncbi:isoprenoid biosynthesis glyoxalase ElbB [Marinibactrum halimedae]|nr:isoprenoid biosynthesis glyoxalase ElbB [Marinibactrum halimedae]MCD9458243.1 isoprenoid biosynthesis glyoxalase ElbB [Marinibactrum halimedae]